MGVGPYHLREAQAAYNCDFTPEKDGLREPKAPVLGTLIYKFQQVRVTQPPIESSTPNRVLYKARVMQGMVKENENYKRRFDKIGIGGEIRRYRSWM